MQNVASGPHLIQSLNPTHDSCQNTRPNSTDAAHRWTQPELSMGPFCVTQPNPTHYKWKNLDPTQANTANNGAYSLVVTYFYTQNLSVSRIYCQIGRKIKFHCLVKPNLI